MGTCLTVWTRLFGYNSETETLRVKYWTAFTMDPALLPPSAAAHQGIYTFQNWNADGPKRERDIKNKKGPTVALATPKADLGKRVMVPHSFVVHDGDAISPSSAFLYYIALPYISQDTLLLFMKEEDVPEDSQKQTFGMIPKPGFEVTLAPALATLALHGVPGIRILPLVEGTKNIKLNDMLGGSWPSRKEYVSPKFMFE